VKFRCLFIHEGKGQIETLSKDVYWAGYELIDGVKESKYTLSSDKTYIMDILKIPDWFATITKESLLKYLNIIVQIFKY